jgi:hypothetical protein
MNRKEIKKTLAEQTATYGGPRLYQSYQFSIAKERGDLVGKLQAEADRQKRSVSWVICEACERYLEEE